MDIKKPFKTLRDIIKGVKIHWLNSFNTKKYMNDYQQQQQHEEDLKDLKTKFINLVKVINDTNPNATPGNLYCGGIVEGQFGKALDLHNYLLTYLKNKDPRKIKVKQVEELDIENSEFNQVDRPEEATLSMVTLGLVEEVTREETQEEKQKRESKAARALKKYETLKMDMVPELVEYVTKFTEMMFATGTSIKIIEIPECLQYGFMEFYRQL